MTLLVGESPAGLGRFELTLGGDVVAVERPGELSRALVERPDDDLVVIGPDVPLEVAGQIAERYRVLRPSLGVVLVRRRLELSSMAEAMRAGIREVVASDDAEGLVTACRRSLAVSDHLRGSSANETGGLGHTVLVFSAKGGCGKTTIATNLAESLALSGRSTVVVDFDLQFGDVAVALQLDPTRSISAAVGMAGGLDRQGITSITVPVRPNFDALLSPMNPADAQDIDVELTDRLVELLQATHDFVIIDSPPAFTDVILRAFDVADTCILITTPDMPAVKNLKITLDTLDALGIPRDSCVIVVNRSDSKTGLTTKDIEAAIGRPVLAQIPASNAVPVAINHGVTMVGTQPKHPVSRAITSIANGLIPAASAKSAGVFGLLRRGA